MPAARAATPFARIGVVGVGLIGGSIAAAARAAWPDVHLSGVDRPDVVRTARVRRLVDTADTTLDGVTGADLVVLAAPVPEIIRMLPEVARAADRAVVTDIGSTKRAIVRAADQAGIPRFVGGHPMAGAECGGALYARADLFRGRPWALVPGAAARDADVQRMARFVEGLGARAEVVDAFEHDRIAAYVSHLPQLLAVSLMNVAGAAAGERGLRLSGRALGEMTRLASSPPDLWDGILQTNADNVRAAAADLAAALGDVSARAGEAGSIAEPFTRAAHWRRHLEV